MHHFRQRRENLRRILQRESLPGMLVSVEKNVSYLTGFSGDSTWLLITPDAELLISDFRYITQLAEECPGIPASIRNSKTSLTDAIVAAVRDAGLKQVGIEGHALSVELAGVLEKKLEGVELISLLRQIEELRAVKDDGEIAEIRDAVRYAEHGFAHLKSLLQPEISEQTLSYELEHAIRGAGGASVSFHPIIAVGDRSALPHYRPGKRTIGESPILLVDWGAQTHSGYKSDITRTFLTAPFSNAEFEKIYKTVLEAQLLAIEKIAPGVSCRDVDAVAREHIQQAGYGEYFDHGLGHGIGLDIHELPRFSQSGDAVLEPGMVVTVEPGIYLAGFGGVRIEDDVLVTSTGCEVLSSVPKSWESACSGH